MQKFIVKEKIGELLKKRKVIAAIFHTFNFDPVFFENYVMPLFIPGKSFGNEMLLNKILWRNCMKDGLIPAVSVFCDYYAKDNTVAPAMGYDIFCIRTPSAKGYICNFHPKNIFLLTEENGKQVLLLLTGSGNITPGGWCDNLECFSVQEIEKDYTYPNKTQTNVLQEYMAGVSQLAGLKNDTDAVSAINDFLRYVNFAKHPYFSSLFESFPDFINRTIFDNDVITEVEIISPYFSPDLVLLNALRDKGVKKISCLIPTLRNNEIQMNRETFVALSEAGVKWCDWRISDLNHEVRNMHAKVYRFYGRKTYTIIGSVNFTHPAWRGYSSRNNQANIESAILYKEDQGNTLLKERRNIDIDAMRFIVKESLENAEDISFGRNAPDLQFTIDWASNTLHVVAKITAPCRFDEILDRQPIQAGKYSIQLESTDIRILTKNSLIKVIDEENRLYSYYAHHLHFEVKPLDFRLDAAAILRYWQHFDEPFLQDLMSRQLAERVTDESGVTNEKLQVKDSLLNIMAAHFVGLISLERKLFRKLQTKNDQRAGFALLKYYLLAHNIDTLISYWNDVEQQMEERKIQQSFFWMISQILLTQFYKRVLKWEYRSGIDTAEWRPFKEAIKSKIEQIQKSTNTHTKDIKDFDTSKKEWAIEQLTTL